MGNLLNNRYSILQSLGSGNPIKIKPSDAFKLRSMGLVKFQGNAVMPLGDLYRIYFCDRLPNS